VGDQHFGEKLPVRMLHDRVLVSLDTDVGERRSTGGIDIPATAQMGKRLSWAEVVAVGGNVRSVQNGDRVLFDPEDRGEIELHGVNYILLRERDIHAVASERIQDGAPGLYI
jgi:chaperonin GroES